MRNAEWMDTELSCVVAACQIRLPKSGPSGRRQHGEEAPIIAPSIIIADMCTFVNMPRERKVVRGQWPGVRGRWIGVRRGKTG